MPKDLEAKIEKEVGDYSTGQELYKVSNGKYEQVKKINETTDGGTNKWVDEYVGPQGVGYIVRMEVKKGGKIYQKSVDYGPEKRSHDWIEVLQNGII